MEKLVNHDVVIIGGGPAGMAAACRVWDTGVKDVVIIDREPSVGGILKQCVHSGFGLHKLGRELTGPEYAAEYAKRVCERNIKVYSDTMVIDINKDKLVVATNRQGILRIQAKAVILAMGCRERSRGALNIPGTRPAGIFSAGTAQKLINCQGYSVGKRVVILGSGDIGLIMARRMTLEGSKVEAVCEIMPYSGGLTRNIVQCLEDYGIPLYLSHTVAQIHGKTRLEGVTIAKVDGNRQIIEETKRYIPCDTLLLSVGLIPENELTKMAGIDIDPVTGGAIVFQDRQTTVPGIFACGNVLQVHDLVDYVSDEAEIAGSGAAAYVMNEAHNDSENVIDVKPGENIRYVLPQKLNISDTQSKVDLYMRVTEPMPRTLFTVCDDKGNVISKNIKMRAMPGEMEKISVDLSLIRDAGSIVVKGETTK